MLKPSPPRPRFKLPPLRVYLNDLERVQQLLSEKCEDISYSTSEFTADQPQDLTGLVDEVGKRAIYDLVIRARMKAGGIITIDLKSWMFGRKVESFSASDAAVALTSAIFQILNSRRRSLLSRVMTTYILPIMFVWGIALGLLSTWVAESGWIASPLTGKQEAAIAIVMCALGLGALGLSWYWLSRNIIHLHRRSERTALFSWEDYKGVIIAVATSLLTLLVIFAMQKLTGWNFN